MGSYRFRPCWYKKMCQKFGKEHVDEKYTFEHCIKDWLVTNFGWEK